MDRTPNLDMPFILPSQAQKHVTHNEALSALDALTQLAVLDRDLAAPPALPDEGDRYIAAAGATGAWAGWDLAIAAHCDGAWRKLGPRPGWIAWVADEQSYVFWDGTAWVHLGTAIHALQNLSLLGIGTAADATNPLAAKLNNALVTARYAAEGGDGDLRIKANKETPGDTVSHIFQTGYSGRAEFGLVGGDDFAVKVSPDGSNWTEALKVDRQDGVTAIQGLRFAPSGDALASLLFTPGGDGAISFYRQDPTSGQNPRSFAVDSVSTDTITLTTTDAAQVFDNSRMNGVCFARIWNTGKTPAQSAWVKAAPAGDQLQVTDAADISAWANGETLQIGDPGSGSGFDGRVVVLDISPMLVNLFGQAFRQKGIMVKASIAGNTDGDALALTPTGASGSFVAAAKHPSSAGVAVIPCTELSPISNSNLVMLRESIATTAGIRIVSSIAVFV